MSAAPSLSTLVQNIWRYRWMALGIAWLTALAGWGVIALIPDKYHSTAVVNVDTETMLRPLLRGIAVDSDGSDARMGAVTSLLLSRSNLEKVAQRIGLAQDPNDPKVFDAQLKGLASVIEVTASSTLIRSERLKAPDLYQISARDQDPQQAQRIVAAVLTVFREYALSEVRGDSSVVQGFLDDKIGEYEAKLRQAEALLREFKQANGGLLPEQGSSYLQRLQEAKGKLTEAELEIRQAERRLAALREELHQVTTTGAANDLEARVRALEAKRDELLMKYTKAHPAYIELEESLRSLKAQGTGSSGPGLKDDRVYQQLKISIGEAEGQLAAAKVKRSEYAKRAEDLERQLQNLPHIEAESQRLNRDYEVIRKNYTELVARREAAKLSQDAGETGEELRFKVVEPPDVPVRPTSPNRLVVNSLALVLALAAGGGAAAARSRARPVFFDRRTLHEATDLPVIGTVSLSGAPAARRLLEVAGVTLIGVALLAAYAALIIGQLLADPALRLLGSG